MSSNALYLSSSVYFSCYIADFLEPSRYFPTGLHHNQVTYEYKGRTKKTGKDEKGMENLPQVHNAALASRQYYTGDLANSAHQFGVLESGATDVERVFCVRVLERGSAGLAGPRTESSNPL